MKIKEIARSLRDGEKGIKKHPYESKNTEEPITYKAFFGIFSFIIQIFDSLLFSEKKLISYLKKNFELNEKESKIMIEQLQEENFIKLISKKKKKLRYIFPDDPTFSSKDFKEKEKDKKKEKRKEKGKENNTNFEAFKQNNPWLLLFSPKFIESQICNQHLREFLKSEFNQENLGIIFGNLIHFQ